MEKYTVEMWLLIFFIYGFLGWLWEVVYVSVRQKRWTNRGFLFGPFLPIYGFGAIFILIFTLGVRNNIIYIYLLGSVGSTILELLAGIIMEILFKIRYWDYSYRKFHYKGYICLHSSIGWGFFSIFLVKILSVPVENLIFSLPKNSIKTIIFILVVLFTADLTKSIQNAFSLKRLLEMLNMNKTTINNITTYLDSFYINTGDFKTYFDGILCEFKKYREQNLLKLSNKQTSLFTTITDYISNTTNILSVDADKSKKDSSEYQKFQLILSQISEIKKRLISSEKSIKNIDLKDFKGAVRLLKRNPTAYSKKLKDAIEELKKIDK